MEPENRDKVDRALMFHETLGLLHENDRPVTNDLSGRRAPWVLFRWAPAIALGTVVLLVITVLVLFEIQRRAHNRNRLATNSAPLVNVKQNANATTQSSADNDSVTAPVTKEPEVELARNDPDKFTQYEYVHRQDSNGGERGGLVVQFVVGPQVKTLALIYEFADDKAAQKQTYGITIKNQFGERIWPQKKSQAEVKTVIRNGGKPRKSLVVKVSIKIFTDGGPYLFELNDAYLPAKQFTVLDSRRKAL